MTPAQAVRHLVHFQDIDNSELAPFEHSGTHDAGLEPFPPSRPATTDLARDQGEALGVKVKPGGNRRMQPVVNKFFYWLRASRLETNRAAYWWANRMLSTQPAAGREDGAVLARPLRHQRGEGARLPQDAACSSTCSTGTAPATSATW